MNTLSTREKWLLALLGPFLMGLLGWFWVLKPQVRKLAGLHARLDAEASAAALREQTSASQAQRAALEKALNDLRAASTGPGTPAFDANAAMQHVSRLCATHGLSLNGATGGDGASVSPLLTAAAGPAAAQPWKVELTGSYAAMQRLLDDLAATPAVVVPLALSMDADATGRHPTAWVLTLWL